MWDVVGYVAVGLVVWLGIPTLINGVFALPLAGIHSVFVRRSRLKGSSYGESVNPRRNHVMNGIMILTFCITWTLIAWVWQLSMGSPFPVLLWILVLIYNFFSLSDENLTDAGLAGGYSEVKAIFILTFGLNSYLFFKYGGYAIQWI